MKKHLSIALLALFATLGAVAQTDSYTLSKVYPLQQDEVGAAQADTDGTTYTLSNNVLSASFVKSGGTLMFGGCSAMNLKAGTELFRVAFGDGTTVVQASEMTLGEVTLEDLEGSNTAVNGAKHFAGKALKATFSYTYSGATVTLDWQAILRDGSHYLRTDLTLRGDQNVKLFNIVPLLYDVDVAAAGSAPQVVGNTRGAVLMSDKLFAGLETPMGINSVTGGNSDIPSQFVYDNWTATSFTWTPGSATPKAILDLGYASDQVVGTRGYLTFKEAGSQTVTFQYSSGTHRLNIVGVDLVDLDGNVAASDYHYGYTGGQKSRNTYTLTVPEAGSYLVRYFIEVKSESITSAGTITYSGSVTAPVVLFDLPSEAKGQLTLSANAPGTEVQSLAGTETEAAALERAVLQRKVLSASTIAQNQSLTDSWTSTSWQQMAEADIPSRIGELGYSYPSVYSVEQSLTLEGDGTLGVTFQYTSGSNRLNLVGVDLVDADGNVAAYDYHTGYTGTYKSNNTYSLEVPYAGTFTLRYLVENSEALTSSGTITVTLTKNEYLHLASDAVCTLQGLWSRNTTLEAGKPWNVSAVVGLVAPGQQRRSFLAYSERERAVPWRCMPAYISWYELNINRNNDATYATNMNINQCVDVVSHWKTHLFDAHQVGIGSFVWDDGWDEYGTWGFNPNFPNGFTEVDQVARQMCSGIGAWLGPVGGYGTSGNYRRAYWNGKGGMQLSNPAYYTVFKNACDNLVRNYDFRFFKFDGISAQFSATGPDSGTTGEENAEAIIYAERDIRQNIKEDIFFNTTVGTWASPFWFHVTDAVWRQENDYGTIGNNSIDRENWITYRDRLVYQNFVQNSPLCPINTLMTHGFILSNYGSVSSNKTYAAVLREMRCAFACGSGMVELYCDYALMNSINGGQLWADLAECIRWQRKNADVLPDIHWVGGNPWDGSKAHIYGWAGWNGRKAVFTLRNGSNAAQSITLTLREALDIPASVSTTVTLGKAFADQAALKGLTEDTPIDIDTPLTLTLPASSVYVFNGTDGSASLVPVGSIQFAETSCRVSAGSTIRPSYVILPLDASDKTLLWTTSNADVATVTDGVVTGIAEGTATITATAADGSGVSAQFQVEVAVIPAESITFDAESYEVTAGKQITVAATVLPADASDKTLLWTTADPSVATVANGVVTGVSEGTTTVTATSSSCPDVQQSATLTVTAAPPYSLNFDADATASRTDRYLTSITVKPATSSQTTLTLDSGHKPYQDLTDQVISVTPGERMTVTFNYQGNWMHGYVFVDEDQSLQFEVTTNASTHTATGDVKAYSFYSFADTDNSGWNSSGSALSGSARNVLNPPAFTAPAAEGTYRIRFKVDWNSLDPGGNDSSGNHILSNGGSITDATLQVTDPTGVLSPSAATGSQGSNDVFDLSGRRLPVPFQRLTHGIYIVGGRKVVK